MTSDIIRRRLIAGLFLALLAWGIYLAIGAFLFNRDVVKGSIVFACSVAFLLFWGTAVWVRQRRPRRTDPMAVENWWTLAAMATAIFALTGMFAPLAGWLTPAAPGYRMVLLAAQICMGASGVLAIVGLSDPRRSRWKWLGLLALVLAMVAFVVGTAIPPVDLG